MKKKFNIWKDWMIAYALTIAFLIQKLTNQIDWSWWEITSPIWGLASIYVALFTIVFIWFQISKLFKK